MFLHLYTSSLVKPDAWTAFFVKQTAVLWNGRFEFQNNCFLLDCITRIEAIMSAFYICHSNILLFSKAAWLLHHRACNWNQFNCVWNIMYKNEHAVHLSYVGRVYAGIKNIDRRTCGNTCDHFMAHLWLHTIHSQLHYMRLTAWLDIDM